jgi:hypothetical protein
MEFTFGSFFIDNLKYDLAYYLVGIIGIVLAIIFWKRNNTAAVLVLIGSILAITMPFVWLLPYFNAIQNQDYSSLDIFSVINNVGRALGFLLAVIGAFIGRAASAGKPAAFQYPGQYPQYPPAQYPPQNPPAQYPPVQYPPAQPPQTPENPQN